MGFTQENENKLLELKAKISIIRGFVHSNPEAARTCLCSLSEGSEDIKAAITIIDGAQGPLMEAYTSIVDDKKLESAGIDENERGNEDIKFNDDDMKKRLKELMNQAGKIVIDYVLKCLSEGKEINNSVLGILLEGIERDNKDLFNFDEKQSNIFASLKESIKNISNDKIDEEKLKSAIDKEGAVNYETFLDSFKNNLQNDDVKFTKTQDGDVVFRLTKEQFEKFQKDLGEVTTGEIDYSAPRGSGDNNKYR